MESAERDRGGGEASEKLRREKNGLRPENLDCRANTGDGKISRAVQRPAYACVCEIGMGTFLPEAWKGLDPDFVDDRLSAGDFPPINGGSAGHDQGGFTT
mgnify:CR=1 FL=1